jgi:Cof subfamily protein (haloacid dehalogenase superfamily)
MIKLIALDLDWTLLDSSRSISAQNAASIRRAVKKGVIVVLASGRNAKSIAQFWADLGLQGPVVSCNGAYVLDGEGKEIYHEAVEDDTRDRLVTYAEDADTHVAIYSRDVVVSSNANEWGDLYASRLRNIVPERVDPSRLRDYPATKVLFVDEPERIQAHKDLLGPEYGPITYMTVSEPEYLEFLAPNVDKSTGIKLIADAHGIKQSEVAAMGDYYNDLEMVRWAGYGGAPANAIEEIKAVADKVFGSNDDHAASQFIDSIVYNL